MSDDVLMYYTTHVVSVSYRIFCLLLYEKKSILVVWNKNEKSFAMNVVYGPKNDLEISL